MSYTYDQRKRPAGPQTRTPERSNAPGPGMDALMNGTARPTAAQKGRSIDLDGAMKARMERAFGDLSAVKFYESPTVGAAGAEAVAQGNEVAFAPGMADFSTRSGRERLGHELSHVMSQRSGAVRRTGFLNDPSLEARADREGALAAAGEQVYSGPVTSALSSASPSPAAAGPMQAKRDDDERGKPNRTVLSGEGNTVMEGTEGYDKLDPAKWEERVKKPGFFGRLIGRKKKYYKARIDRRPWEMDKEDIESNPFNPNAVPDVARIQSRIETAADEKDAETPEQKNGLKNRMAWTYFQEFASGPDEQPIETPNRQPWDMSEVDNEVFTTKLKHMSRMVYDYPELQENIGALQRLELPEEQKARLEKEKKKEEERKLKFKPTLRQRLKRKKKSGAAEDNQEEEDKSKLTVYMAARSNARYDDKGFTLKMNSIADAKGEEAKQKREEKNQRSIETGHGAGGLYYAGNHEMGHMLNYLLVKEKNRHIKDRELVNAHDFKYQTTANELVDRTLKAVMPAEEYANLVRYQEDSLGPNEEWDPSVQLEDDEEWVTNDDAPRHKKGQIDLAQSNIAGKGDGEGYTSGYGASSAAEFFAEAFADVYRKGNKARPASIKLVQLYEEEMKKAKADNKIIEKAKKALGTKALQAQGFDIE